MVDETEVSKEVQELQTKVDEVTKLNTELQADVKILTAEKAAIQAVNDSLTKELSKAVAAKPTTADATKPKAPVTHLGKSFEVDGKKYELAYPKVVFKGNPITADDIVADKALQAELVAANHSIVKLA